MLLPFFLLISLILCTRTQTTAVLAPSSAKSPHEKLEALIEAGLTPQILVATNLEKGDHDGLVAISEEVIDDLRKIGVEAKVGFYLNMLAMFTLYANNLDDGLRVLNYLQTHEKVTNYEVDSIAYPDLGDDYIDEISDADLPKPLPDDEVPVPIPVLTQGRGLEGNMGKLPNRFSRQSDDGLLGVTAPAFVFALPVFF